MYFRRDEIEKLNPWRDLPKKPPFVLRQDKEFVDRHNAEQTRAEYKARLEVPPNPYAGNPETARVLLLTRMPLWDDKNLDDYAENPAYAQALHRSLTFTSDGYPFVYLDPAFEQTAGYQWWRPKLRDLVLALEEKYGEDAQRKVAERVMAVTYFPYHAAQYEPNLKIKPMPSQKYSFGLVQLMAREELPIIIQSLAPAWNAILPTQRGKVIKTRSDRSNYLSKKNLPAGEFEALVELLTRD